MAFDTVLLAHQPSISVALPVFHAVFQATAVPFLETFDAGPEPIAIPFDWEPLAGADGVRVDPVTVTIAPPGPSVGAINIGELVHRVVGGAIHVEIPNRHRVATLHLAGLHDADGDIDLVDAADYQSGGWRLAITPIDASGQYFAPAVTVPAVGANGQRNTMFGGGSFGNRTLTLPDLEAHQVRIALVNGDAPDFPESKPLEVDTVTGWAAPHPRDLAVDGPDGAPLWAFPGTLLAGTPPAVADLTVGLQAALAARFEAGDPLSGAATITAAQASKVALDLPTVRGALVRSVPGTTTVVLAGDPAEVTIDGPDLPQERPTDVVADVHVVYDGIRLAEISDLLPTSRAVSGRVVRSEPAVRALPPSALRDERIARVGLVGRSSVASDLSIHVVDATPGADHAPLAPPAVCSLDATSASEEFTVVWATFDPPIHVDRPVGISVTVTDGSFWWVGEPEPLVRIAVVDPDPGGRPILLAGATLLTLDAPTLAVDRAALPGAGFVGAGFVDGATAAEPLEFASALFCTVELTDVSLRYARPRGGG